MTPPGHSCVRTEFANTYPNGFAKHHIIKGLFNLPRLQIRLQESIVENTPWISPLFWESCDHVIIAVSVFQALLQLQSFQFSCSDFLFRWKLTSGQNISYSFWAIWFQSQNINLQDASAASEVMGTAGHRRDLSYSVRLLFNILILSSSMTDAFVMDTKYLLVLIGAPEEGGKRQFLNKMQ